MLGTNGFFAEFKRFSANLGHDGRGLSKIICRRSI